MSSASLDTPDVPLHDRVLTPFPEQHSKTTKIGSDGGLRRRSHIYTRVTSRGPSLTRANLRLLTMFRHSLRSIAQNAEDVAAGLRTFRDHLPRSSTRITACISELFALSSVLREINNGEGDVHFAASFYHVQDDLTLVLPSMQWTLLDALQILANPRDRPVQLAWNELELKMSRQASFALLDRLEMYRAFLRFQADVLQRRCPPGGQQRLRQDVLLLLDAQEESNSRAERERRFIDSSGEYLPYPTLSHHQLNRS